MPNYLFDCARCRTVVEAFMSMAERDIPGSRPRCPSCARRMTRETVYAFATRTNEASVWPYRSDALVPKDRALLARYRREGRLVPDEAGAPQVEVRDEADYKRLCREQRLRPLGDYEKLNRSVTRPQAREKAEASAGIARLGRERAREAVRRKGIDA